MDKQEHQLFEKQRGKLKSTSSSNPPKNPKSKKTRSKQPKPLELKQFLQVTHQKFQLSLPLLIFLLMISQNVATLALKVNQLIVDHQYKIYAKDFLNKPIEVEYYIDKAVESDIDIEFL